MSIAERVFLDWSGRTTEHGIRVLRLVRRTPPAYAVQCVKCGCEAVEPHRRIEYAECKNSACSKPTRRRDRLDDERERARAREQVALAEEHRRADERMQSETEDHTLRPSRPPVAEYVPMSDRERQAIRQRREEERLEQEERERPIKEAEEAIKATHRRIAEMQRDTLTNPQREDIDVFIADEVAGLRMRQDHADAFNLDQFKEFHEKHPDFHPSARNIDLLHDYHLRNHCGIYTSAMISSVYRRMVDAGVEFDQPAPEPELEDYTKRPVRIRIAPPVKPEPVTYAGWDVETGEPRTYSEREINRMSGDAMKRALRLTAVSGVLNLPYTGPMTRA